MEHPYKQVTLHRQVTTISTPNIELKQVKYFIENEYGMTNEYLAPDELEMYIKHRMLDGTPITINP